MTYSLFLVKTRKSTSLFLATLCYSQKKWPTETGWSYTRWEGGQRPPKMGKSWCDFTLFSYNPIAHLCIWQSRKVPAMEYYSVIKRMKSCQQRMTKYPMISLTCGVWKTKQMSKQNKTETDSQTQRSNRLTAGEKGVGRGKEGMGIKRHKPPVLK